MASNTTNQSTTPVLRWLGTWSPKGKQSNPSSSSPTTSHPPSPSLLSLNEALSEPLDLPKPPPRAQPFSSTRSLSRLGNPPYLDSLTRSTLPTASVCATYHDSSSSRPPSPRSPASLHSPIKPTRSPPTRSSLDTLRSVSRRDSTVRSRRSSAHIRSSSTSTTSISSEDDSKANWWWLPSGSRTSASALEGSTDEQSDSNNISWWWFQSGNKANVDDLLDESDRAGTVQEEQAHIKRYYLSPRNPVVFCHGLLGFDSVTIGPSIAPLEVSHWRGIKEVLEASGSEVLITRVPATSSPLERAKVLEAKISEVYPGRSVHLIGHSMGGLDCRYLTTHFTHRKFEVLSITTVATPHRGSSFADHFLSTLGKERMSSFVQLLDLLPNGGGDGTAFECLTVESMRKFNEEVPDVEGVKYFSWGAVYEPGLIDTWKWPHGVILEKEGPNDGLVSVESAKWGKYLGTLEGVNHLDLVGWINPARYRWAAFTGKEIKYRPATFYLGVADMLAKQVEGQTVKDDDEHEHQDTNANKAGRGADVRPPTPTSNTHSRSSNTSTPKPNTNHDEIGPTDEVELDSHPKRIVGPTRMLFAGDGGSVINHTMEALPQLLNQRRGSRTNSVERNNTRHRNLTFA
ncbi:alpha/beta-hydrolase [Marasmius fiardii PR-910]|nr:alpha/beta-hydrolase [Marasmius fiardii PR-910]